ncbi:hypothetical protein AWB65_06848 [Caballeronia humi]|uniref:Uncharacterized protein n=1 Tax=Caballeronia humi TaxID=326474 RepID=A0A158JLP5_9BURK|nr:hypothetical protein AWB65_06848 [Caballeronia humi]
MDKVSYPLKIGTQGTAVVQLHAALQLCLKLGVLVAESPRDRAQLAFGLAHDRARALYGDATATLVDRFQGERRLLANGEVDAAVADALNELIRGWDSRKLH